MPASAVASSATRNQSPAVVARSSSARSTAGSWDRPGTGVSSAAEYTLSCGDLACSRVGISRGEFLKPRSQVRFLPGAPIYDVCKNFALGGFGRTRARRGHHGEGGACACFDDDFVFTDDDVVNEIFQVDVGSARSPPRKASRGPTCDCLRRASRRRSGPCKRPL